MAKGNSKNVASQQQHSKGKLHTQPSARQLKKSGHGALGGVNTNQHPRHNSTVKEEQSINSLPPGKAAGAGTPNVPNNTPITKIDTAESDVETVEVNNKEKLVIKRDSATSTSMHPEKHGEKSGRGGGRFIIKNLWEVCCNETESEVKELDTILQKLGLPSVNYSKTKAYDITDYEFAPDIPTCKSKDFLDFYVFPYLLPAIQALIQFARVNRVFQCRFCTFNALDYIVEYLYNNNPRYPERMDDPVPIFEIPFAKAWLQMHPRKPPPKWMLMSSEEAAIIIQRAVRGYMVRNRPDVQEMRQFWRDYRKDMEDEKAFLQYGKDFSRTFPPASIFSPYYEEYHGEFEESCESPCIQLPAMDGLLPPSPTVSHHSDHCVYCEAFRRFLSLQSEDILKSYQRPSIPDNLSAGGDQPVKLSIGGGGNADEPIGSAEGHISDGGGEHEGDSHHEKSAGARKDSGPSGGAQPPPSSAEAYLSANSSKVNPHKAHKVRPGSAAHKSFTVAKGKPDKKSRKPPPGNEG